MAIGAIYARSSLGREKQGETVEHQIAMIQEFAKRMKMNVKFDKKFIYEDDGQSGYKTTLLQRPSMRRMMEDIDNGLVDIVFCKGISRLTRNAGEAITTAKRLTQKGVRVISMEENYDSDKSDPTMFQIYSVMAESESRKTSIRVSLGNRQKARNGLWAGSITPFGYVKVKNIQDEQVKKKAYESGLKDESLYPVEDERIIVEQIFDLFINEKVGRKVISSRLNQKGYRTRKGGLFSDKFIKDTLLNMAYVGDIVYGKTRYEYIDNDEEQRKVQTTVTNNEDDWAICRNAHPPIIDRDTFKKAQRIMEDKKMRFKQPKRFNAAKHPLTGILECGKCGAPMICQKRSNKMADGTKKEYRYYVCSTYHSKGRHICDQANVNADNIEDRVHEYIQNRINKFKERDVIISEMKGKDSNKKNLEKELSIVEESIQKKIRAMSALLENIDEYDSDVFKQLNANIKSDVDGLKMAKEKLEFQLDQIVDDFNSDEIEQMTNDYLGMDITDIDDKRRKFHDWLDKVVIKENVVEEIIDKVSL